MLLAVQDQSDVDVEQPQQPALVRIIGLERAQESGRRGDAAIACRLGRRLVGVDRIFLADGFAEQPDLAGLDRRGEWLERMADKLLVERNGRLLLNAERNAPARYRRGRDTLLSS
jgi:hypothetical protein